MPAILPANLNTNCSRLASTVFTLSLYSAGREFADVIYQIGGRNQAKSDLFLLPICIFKLYFIHQTICSKYIKICL